MQPEPEPESGAGWQGRGVCLREGRREPGGAQGEGVSHGRAPAGSRLERGLRDCSLRLPPARPTPSALQLGQES